MKSSTSTGWFAITADQRRSRTSPDRVPAALSALAGLPGLALAFERTAGDELQGLTADPATVVAAVAALTRVGGFRIGIGFGEVDEPLPASTRAARGPAYLAAREGVDQHSQAVRVVTHTTGTGAITEAATDAETVLLALSGLLERRTAQGWEVVDLVESGLTGAQAAARLGITASAVSQRLKVADHGLVKRLTALAERLLAGVAS
ncbi:transposase [Aestuariimicrobium soli]|uniref:transposase n=1 Tax=Aestuariimicrobium soli TaxID=2035834 RepID=UPI003EBC76AC